MLRAFSFIISVAILAGSITALSAAPIDKEKIWEENRASVVKIHTFGRGADGQSKSIDEGTGVFISPDGYILTALHVVGADDDWSKAGDGMRPDRHVEIIALGPNGVARTLTQNASVRAIPGSDLALLRIDGSCFNYSLLASERPTGYPTLVVGLWGKDVSPHPTSVDLTQTDISKWGDKLTIEKIVAIGGYSGSPIFDATGKIVGILTERLGEYNALAVPSTDAIAFLPFRNTIQEEAKFPPTCYRPCEHPDHGLDHWGHEEPLKADSGWRVGGYDPVSYCAAQKLQLEQTYPGRQIVLQPLPEDHKTEYDPFKRDYYRYFCSGVMRWEPHYRIQRSPACGLANPGR